MIGTPHVSGRAAMRMLEEEGFSWENYVDIFDGGPTMTARTDQIRSVRDAKDAKIVAIDDALGDHKDGEKMLITHGRLGEFKAAYGWVKPQGDGIALDPVGAGSLGLATGDSITYIPRS